MFNRHAESYMQLILLCYTNMMKATCSWFYYVTQTWWKLHVVDFTMLHKHAESYMQLILLCYTNMLKATCSWFYYVTQTCWKLHAVVFYYVTQTGWKLHAVDFTMLHKHDESYIKLILWSTCSLFYCYTNMLKVAFGLFTYVKRYQK